MPRPTLADARAALRTHLGFESFRPGQAGLIASALAGRDALGVLPTGAGKSVCYQIPALLLPGTVIVVSPLISLMQDQEGRARSIGIRAAALSSALPRSASARIFRELARGALALLFVSPERFGSADFRAVIAGVKVSLLAIDEAHCISEWGHDFRPSYRQLGSVRRALGAPTLAVTASATPRVRADLIATLGLRNPEIVISSFDRPNLTWAVAKTGRPATKTRLVRQLLTGRDGGSALVYCATRRSVEVLETVLCRWGMRAEGYHAGRTAEERAGVQERFLEGRSRVVIATSAFGMGIDRADVRQVVHFELPLTLESYYQESGRAGRDGDPALCLALSGPGDSSRSLRMVRRAHPSPRTLRRAHAKLVRVLGCVDGGRVTPAALAEALHPVPPARHAALLAALGRAGGVVLGPRTLERIESRGANGPGTPHSGKGSLTPLALSVVPVLGGLSAVRTLRKAATQHLRAVRAWARSAGCRRAGLLSHFGEAVETANCGACDRCLGIRDPRQLLSSHSSRGGLGPSGPRPKRWKGDR